MKHESPQAWFHERATQYVEANILFHLNQVGVLHALWRRPWSSVAQIHETCAVDARVLAVLLDYIVGVDELIARREVGDYGLTDFGRQVLARYSRTDAGGEISFNLFDVRVGAYGPIWAGLTDMLRGRVVERAGQHAANATHTISPHMAPTVVRVALERRVDTLVEVGVPTGMLAHMEAELAQTKLVGLDIDAEALERARQHACKNGGDRISWVQGDVFEPGDWADQVDGQRGAFVTIHMHELAARGLDAIRDMLAKLSRCFPGWLLLALEQDRLPDHARDELAPDLWLYSQSNVLIHHLIRNARILSRRAWTELFESAGCELLDVEEMGYLGYHAYIVRL